jgi:hypothetical protein
MKDMGIAVPISIIATLIGFGIEIVKLILR